jgi:hypothetical protein
MVALKEVFRTMCDQAGPMIQAALGGGLIMKWILVTRQTVCSVLGVIHEAQQNVSPSDQDVQDARYFRDIRHSRLKCSTFYYGQLC